MKISLIIPVYNAEDFIEETLRSVTNQYYQDLEIIIIDDGSREICARLLDDLASADNRIKLYRQANSGVSTARNRGLEMATGDFVGFVDADDFLEQDMVMRFVEEIKDSEPDWIICNVDSINDSGERRARRSFPQEKIHAPAAKENFQVRMMRGEFDNANWNKLYKREIITKYQIKFTENLFLWEDLAFNIIFSIYAQRISLIRESLYIHRIHPGSLFRSNSSNRWAQFCTFSGYLEKEFRARKKTMPEWLKGEISRAAFYTELPSMLSAHDKKIGFSTWSNKIKSSLTLCNKPVFNSSFTGVNSSARAQVTLLKKGIYTPLVLWWWIKD